MFIVLNIKKYGLFQIHFLIFLYLDNRLLEIFYINKIICTKLPNLEIDTKKDFIRIITLIIFYNFYKI